MQLNSSSQKIQFQFHQMQKSVAQNEAHNKYKYCRNKRKK